jgi:hypothetical protein
MTTNNESKLKKLLDLSRPGTVLLAKWLETQRISRDLQSYYRKNGWLESIGTGAFKRPNDSVNWQGAVYALQQQARMPVHAGAMTALSLQGFAHYFRLTNETVFLFSPLKARLPSWIATHSWGQPIEHVKTSLLPEDLALSTHEEKSFSINVSSPERAMLECLYLAPEKLDLTECFQLMQGLSNLRPKVVQELLEKCSSIKAKRLFLFMATKAQHQWLNFVDRKKIDLGEGDRSITKGGFYNSDFRISIPKELA